MSREREADRWLYDALGAFLERAEGLSPLVVAACVAGLTETRNAIAGGELDLKDFGEEI